MDKEKSTENKIGLKVGRFYRCRPTMSQANIIGPYLVDLEGLNLQFFNLKDFTLFQRVPLLSKQDQYCAQLSVLSPKILVIFGVDKFMLFDIEKMQVSETVKVNNYIEKTEARNNFVVILTSDQDSEHKIINCWRINLNSGKVEQKYKSTQFLPEDYEECTEENMCMNLIMSIEGYPKTYIYWKDTTYMIEVDPRNQLNEKYNRHHPVSLVFDLSPETYAEVLDKNIIVNSKQTGKKLAQLVSQGQKFTQLFSDGSKDKIYSLSNLGLKRWKLQSNSSPVLYISSDKQQIKKVFFKENEEVIGLNMQTNTVVIWKNPEEYSSYSFPNEVIRRVIKINDHQVFFLLQATASSQQENQYHVSKYNKLEVFDFSVDSQIAKKVMLKSQHSVDTDSVIVNDSETIRFIVNERGQEGGQGDKKYILRWTPFTKDENGKDTKKKQIKGAQAFDILRLYSFNRILGITLAKKSQSFSLFSKEEQKTQVVLFDYSVKKIGDYDLHGEILNAELSEKNLMYAIGSNRVFVYSIAVQHKNRLEKINQLDISAMSVTPIRDFLLIRKDTSFLLLDADFECIMREETNQNDKNHKILPVDQDRFLLKTDTRLQLWDTSKEIMQAIEAPECQPNIVEFMDGKLVITDKWVQVYDIKLS